MSELKRVTLEDFPSWAETLRRPFHEKYYAMYSSVYNALVTEPVLMMVPVDDHVVHRGDGVFETFKCVEGFVYNLDAHLNRLQSSAEQVGLALPCSPAHIRELVIATIRAGGRADCSVRLLVSRGPGSLGVDPGDCPRSELYIVVSAPGTPFATAFPEGARAKFSAIPVKPGFLATVKCCNYLPNVLMKKEASDAGVDFVVSLDENGFLAEGPAETAAIVTQDQRLQFPQTGRILPGTTMGRAVELAQQLVTRGVLSAVECCDISQDFVRQAAELLLLGTTPDIAAVVEFEGRTVGDGTPGPICRELGKLLSQDMRENVAVRTAVFE